MIGFRRGKSSHHRGDRPVQSGSQKRDEAPPKFEAAARRAVPPYSLVVPKN